MRERISLVGKKVLTLAGSQVTFKTLATGFLILVVIFFLSPVIAVGSEVATESSSKTLSPYFFVESGNDGLECFPLKSTSVAATINGVIADVKVTQEYANTGAKPINARR